MSCSTPLPPFTFDLLCHLNREQLERFSIVCQPLKNFIDRYFRSKPYRVIDELLIRGESYALFNKEMQCSVHKLVQWHPNREDYSTQQFLAGQRCSDLTLRFDAWDDSTYYSFAEMRPYFGPTTRIKWITIYVARDSTYNPEQMESISYLWRDGFIYVRHALEGNRPISAEDFEPILNSPTILQCRYLKMYNAHFSFKQCKALYAVKFIENWYGCEEINPNDWPEFLEQPGVKPFVILRYARGENITNILDRFCKIFSSAVLPNAFKIAFEYCGKSLTEFRETNKITGEKIELKKGIPKEYENYFYEKDSYILERSIT